MFFYAQMMCASFESKDCNELQEKTVPVSLIYMILELKTAATFNAVYSSEYKCRSACRNLVCDVTINKCLSFSLGIRYLFKKINILKYR